MDLDAISGDTKVVYDKMGLRNFLPSCAIIQKDIGEGFEKGARVGDTYNISVTLQLPCGFTYSGSDGSSRALKSARSQIIKQASIRPFEMNLREEATFIALSRAKEEGPGAFAGLVGTTMKNMKLAASNAYEMSLLHGQRGFGTVESVTDLGSNLANIVITADTVAPGLWWAMIGRTLDSFTSTTLNNGTGPLIVKKWTSSTRTLKVQYSGTIGSECAAGDVLYPEGAYDGTTHYEMPSLLTQSSNLTGTSCGLSADTYPNWAGNLRTTVGQLSSDVCESLFGELRDRGAQGRIKAYASNKGFGVLLSELKSLRVIDSSYSPQKGKTGHEAVAMISPDFGEVEIVHHPFMKDSELWLANVAENVAHVGSSPFDFGVPGTDTPKWEKVQGYNKAEIGLFADQAAMVLQPAQTMLATGITYSA